MHLPTNKSRKNALSAALAPAHPVDADPHMHLMIFAKPQVPTLADIALALQHEARNLEIDRINSTPLGDPLNQKRLDHTFEPIEKWLAEFEATGEYNVIDDPAAPHRDLAVFQPDGEQEQYPIIESFNAVCATYMLIAEDREHDPAPIDGLRKLANKIKYDMPMHVRDLQAARASIAWMREVSKPITPAEFSEYTKEIQRRAALAKHAKE